MLAFVLLFSAHVGWRDLATARDRAGELAHRAAALDDQDAWTHVVLGYLHTMKRNFEAANQAYSTAIRINPNFAAAYGWRSFAKAHAGIVDEAIDDSKMARRLSPQDPQNIIFQGGEALAYFMSDRFDEAAAVIADVIRQRPQFEGAWRLECTALARAGRLDEAKAVLARILEKQPNLTAAQLRASLPYPTAETLEKFVGGLVLAGLPE